MVLVLVAVVVTVTVMVTVTVTLVTLTVAATVTVVLVVVVTVVFTVTVMVTITVTAVTLTVVVAVMDTVTVVLVVAVVIMASVTWPVSTSVNSVARPSDWLSGHAQLEIQAEIERSLANARPVMEVKIKFNFFATRMSDIQSDCFFSMLGHVIVQVCATEFARKPAFSHGRGHSYGHDCTIVSIRAI